MDEFKKNIKQSMGFRILVFSLAFFFCMLIAFVISSLFGKDGNIMMIKLGQGLASVVWYVVPPIILYVITRDHPMSQLGFRKPARAWMLLVGVVLMFISLPVTNLLTSWNEKMDLGSSFASLEAWMKQMEDSASALTQRILEVNTVWGLLLNLLVIALIPAIGEELTFRGVLQQALTRNRENPHVAIVVSAAIFSFIHFQFYGFFPRMFLGMILGYMFYYSGSIWTSILMHFINNGTAVVVAYLDYNGFVNIDWEHFGSTSGLPLWANISLLVASLALTVGLIVIVAKKQYKYGRE